MNAGQHRYRVLDTWRYLAAVAVVFYHFENHFAPFRAVPTHYLEQFGHFVDFFFVLSGFVLMHTYGTTIRDAPAYYSFMRKRFARLYPLHVLTSLPWIVGGAVIALFALKVNHPGDFDAALIAPTLLLVHAWGFTSHPGMNFPSWSISSEFFVYFLFPVFALVLARIRPLAFIGLALVFALVMEAIRFSLGMRSFTEATFDFGMLRAVPTFLAGMATYAIVNNLSSVRIPWALAHGSIVLILGLMLLQTSTYVLLLLYPFAVGLIALAERNAPSLLGRPFFTRLGDASYGIYMLHSIVQIGCVSLVRKFDLIAPWQLVAVAIAGTIFVTVLAMLSFTWFETPARRFISQPGAFWPLTRRAKPEPTPERLPG